MIFEELDEFRKDRKALMKKYRSLYEDLGIVKQILEIAPDERPPFSFRIDNLGIGTCVIKVRKIAFIEIYHKNDKENEDRQRILDNFK